MVEIRIKKPKITKPKLEFKPSKLLPILLLVVATYLAYYSRTSSVPSLIADYDPWYQYRHAKEIFDNSLIPPKWDLLSFSPPGRPFPSTTGWMYTMIFFYKFLSFTNITFLKAAILSPAIMVALSAIAGYLLGKELSSEWGGLATAIFATMSPTFIGVSVAGYSDTDTVVVFYSLIAIFSMFLAMRKKSWFYILFAVVVNTVFIINWWFGWYVQFFFLLLIPSLFGYKIIMQIIRKRLKINLSSIWQEYKGIIKSLLIITIIVNIIMFLMGQGSLLNFIIISLGFKAGEGVIVNVSVAELQPINILTESGFNAVAARVGDIPIKFMLIGLPVLAVYKLYKKDDISFEEIFLYMWSAVTFYMILNGVRFSLLFSVAVAASAGYVIGNLINYFKDKNIYLKSIVYGLILFLVINFASQTLAFAMNVGGFDISGNWINMMDWLKENADKNALITTWWDPGHIIAGYTGLRVHADGAHCSPTECIPYNHNDRIQDMGRIMSTSNETEAVELLKKYVQLSPEQCREVKKKYGDIVPPEACESASEVYFISSSDLIGKFTWMNYFGGYRAPISLPQDIQKNPGVCCAPTPKTEPGQLSCGEFANQGYGLWVYCPWIFNLQDVQKDQEGNDAFIYDYGGLKLSVIQKPNQLIPVYNNKYVVTKMFFFDQSGVLRELDFTDVNTTLEKIDGMIWVQPDLRGLILFSPAIKDSIFVRTFFFNGDGLKHFELVYSNSEVRLYRVDV